MLHGIQSIDWLRLIWVACVFAAAQAWAVAQAAEPPPPNIVWLTVEDMSPWIGPYGDATVPTPHLDRLAREGVVYDNAFATSPVCAPARSALITGMFCTRIGTMHMRNGRPFLGRYARERDDYRRGHAYDTGDLGFVLPEATLVKDHIWPPEGQQPATPPAEIDDKAVLRGDSMVFVVSLSCPDPGASIGYRLGTEKQYSGPWQVYTTPFEVPADRRFIEVRTHRIGHTPTTTGALLGGE